MIEEGTRAPDFELPDQDGRPFKLSDQRGAWIVLYFYPRADTPGCTAQACSARDRSPEYGRAGAKLVGISPDDIDSIAAFAAKHALPFTLLADADHEVADSYGTWGEKKMYGRTWMGVSRSTFVIDPKGTVARVFPKVSPKTHDDVVLDALAELAA